MFYFTCHYFALSGYGKGFCSENNILIWQCFRGISPELAQVELILVAGRNKAITTHEPTLNVHRGETIFAGFP